MLHALTGFLSPTGRRMAQRYEAPEWPRVVTRDGTHAAEAASDDPGTPHQPGDRFRRLVLATLPGQDAGIVRFTSDSGKTESIVALSRLLLLDETHRRVDILDLDHESAVEIERTLRVGRLVREGHARPVSPMPRRDPVLYGGHSRVPSPAEAVAGSPAWEPAPEANPPKRQARRLRWTRLLRGAGRAFTANRQDARHVVQALRALLENASLALRACGRRADTARCPSRTFPWTPLRSSATLHAPPTRDSLRLVTTKAGRVTPA